MRRGNKPQFLTHDESGKFLGINLGADYCAEHEWGIKGIRRNWGIPTPEEADEKMIFGANRYRISDIPLDKFKLFLDEENNEAYLVFDDSVNPRCKTEKEPISVQSLNKSRYLGSELSLPDDGWEKMKAKREKRPYVSPTEFVSAAWDERSFGIHVKGVASLEYIKRIYQAFLDKNICIFMGGTRMPCFENAGLQIVIASQIPADGEEMLRSIHVDAFSLKKAAAATGIADRLKEAECRYYALSPKWKKDLNVVVRDDEDERFKTAHDVVFWLNPMEQQQNNSGWYTVEQLDQWIKGEGPIPKKAVTA